MSPAKNLGVGGGGELDWDGYKENFRGESKNVIKFYSRFVNILRVGRKISKKCHFWPNFPIVAYNFFGLGGGSRLRILLGVRGKG